MLDIKHCPFCGGKPRVFELYANKLMTQSGGWDVECKCGAYMNAETKTMQGAVDKWNRRSPSLHVEPLGCTACRALKRR